jgi:hypothetical protein
MTTYPFLSPEWTAAARVLHAEYAGTVATPPGVAVRMNLVVTEVPFADETILAHLDTISGQPEIDLGHLDGPDCTITVDYETAKAILVDQDSQAAMQAFLSGRIKVDGDLSRLMALQGSIVDPSAGGIASKIREITD